MRVIRGNVMFLVLKVTIAVSSHPKEPVTTGPLHFCAGRDSSDTATGGGKIPGNKCGPLIEPAPSAEGLGTPGCL